MQIKIEGSLMDDVPIHVLLSNLIRDVSSVYEIVAYLSSRSSHAILWEKASFMD
jgi:hypothetical protein